ncbi:MAG: YraN family protein [Nitrospinae bacterium]|nr:YraN family protein [Nitrospinota bacterium]
MSFKRLRLGKDGESAAASYLKKRGYRILEKNFRTAAGEIDIIAEHERTVVFIEVKTRSDGEFGHPSLAVTSAKRKKLAVLAKSFLARHKIEGRDCRFDVVSIVAPSADPKSWVIELLQDAFRI